MCDVVHHVRDLRSTRGRGDDRPAVLAGTVSAVRAQWVVRIFSKVGVEGRACGSSQVALEVANLNSGESPPKARTVSVGRSPKFSVPMRAASIGYFLIAPLRRRSM